MVLVLGVDISAHCFPSLLHHLRTCENQYLCLLVRVVTLIFGNDLAGEKVFPTPEVVDNPVPHPSPSVCAVFPACAMTCAQS